MLRVQGSTWALGLAEPGPDPPESPLQARNRARLQGLRGVMKVSTTCDRRNWAGSAS